MRLATAVLCILILSAGSYAGQTLPASQFDQQLTALRTSYSVFALQAADSGGSATPPGQNAVLPKHYSPAKAFVMSLIVPGLGELYSGSKVKAAGFFAFDVTAWVLNFKYRADGNDLTDQFQKFQQTNWQLANYQKYLLLCYGYADDDSIVATEVSHHLPHEPTQQYYEMTGKYDQFSWGWIDATYQGHDISYYGTTDTMPRITDHSLAPASPMRYQYETMRYNANHKFDVADRWVIVSLANHLISAFDALLTAQHKNAHATSGEFGRIKVKADLKSIYARHDTPYLRFSYAF